MSGAITEWLQRFLDKHGAVAGTVHERAGDALRIVAHHNIPPKVVEITAVIPRGKGMAGIAFAEDRAVTTCNLKDDDSGAVKPGAKAVDAQAAVAFPVHDDGGQVRAVVGIAWPQVRELTRSELDGIAASATDLP